MEKLPYENAKDEAIRAIVENKVNAEIWVGKDKRTLNIEFYYPRLEDKINKIEIGLSDVRASDGIRVSYDFERDGYVIEQPYIIEVDKGSYIDASTETWEEVGFFPSWNLEEKGKKINN